ncbi:MAG: hypothetical protein CMN30_08380 [Sandaracinus sp.]|nr:hypothetical protein [Sandaracinus sp.]
MSGRKHKGRAPAPRKLNWFLDRSITEEMFAERFLEVLGEEIAKAKERAMIRMRCEPAPKAVAS